MRSFDPDVVTRLLDLVSTNFQYVVFDMPRTWFSWTDSVLLGSNKLFIVSETTVPGLRHAKQLVAAIKERLGEGPNPQVIINRFQQKMFSAGLRRSDVEQALGDSFAACIPNDYGMVREAIDRGVPLDEVKPGNKITAQIKKLLIDPAASKPGAAEAKPASLLKKLKLVRSLNKRITRWPAVLQLDALPRPTSPRRSRSRRRRRWKACPGPYSRKRRPSRRPRRSTSRPIRC